MNNPNFWVVFKADLLFGLCWATFTFIVFVSYTAYKARKAKRQEAARALFDGPRPPGLCPLCGRDWPLPGPVPSDKEHVVILAKTLEKRPE
jgi:hypothetical protein